MIPEIEQENVKENFLEIVGKEDLLETREFLNHQNISDVAFLVYELPDLSSKIISNMSIHRAASVFKILDFSTQKSIIQELPPYITSIVSLCFPSFLTCASTSAIVQSTRTAI